MIKHKVVLSDNVFSSLELEKLKLAKIEAFLIESPSSKEDDIMSVAKDADALLVGYAHISKKIVKSLKKCKIISRYGIGIGNIDVETAKQQGIDVTNVPDYCIDEVSDHTLSLLLALSFKIIPLDHTVKSGIGLLTHTDQYTGKMGKFLD